MIGNSVGSKKVAGLCTVVIGGARASSVASFRLSFRTLSLDFPKFFISTY